MKSGLPLARVRSISAEALTTLIQPGGVTLALAVDAASVRESPPLCTVVRLPFEGVSMTCTIVPTGRLEPSRATVTGFGCDEGTMTSGTPCSDPSGAAGALTPPIEAMRSVGEFGGVIGCGNAKLMMFDGVVVPVKLL